MFIIVYPFDAHQHIYQNMSPRAPGLTTRNKKLLGTSASLLVTSALLVVTRTLRTGLLALLLRHGSERDQCGYLELGLHTTRGDSFGEGARIVGPL